MAADDWKKLTPYSHSRLRTEMYFGSRSPRALTVLEYDDKGARPVETTWVPAVFTAFREVLDNALDEVVTHGNGDRVDVTYDPATMMFSVQDNGRGIPIDWSDEHKNWAATILLSETMAGRNFEAERGDTRGMNGVGASIVNYVSDWFRLEIERDQKRFEQLFRGEDELVIEEAMVFPSNAKKTGTKVSFQLSSKVFPDLSLPESFIRARMTEVALCYPNLKLFYNGARVVTKGVESSLFGDRKPIQFTIDEPDFHSRFWLVPNFLTDQAEYAHGLVNAIPVFDGGLHIDAFKRGFFSGLMTALTRESKRRKLVPNRSDFVDGLMIFNITQMKAPVFDGQAKTRLSSDNVAKMVTKTIDDPEFFKKVIKANPEWIESVYKRCADRTTKRDMADVERDMKKQKREKIEDLEDACATDRQKCILFLGEGKSAISGMVDARDPDIHGGLPLRGKIMNVHGVSIKDIVGSEVLNKIIRSIGLTPNVRANRRTLRYGKVYITTDADEDGKNIAALIVNFFYTLWPELFDAEREPFLYVFDTPLIIAAKGKQRRYWFNEDYHKFDAEAQKGWEITRAKGLAALKREDWKHVLATPKLRPIVDNGELKEALDLLFDEKRADDRKAWIGQ